MSQRYTFATITGLAIADMPRKWIATIVLSAWCGAVLAAESAWHEAGRQLFEQSACNACHTPAVEDGPAFAGVDFERPPRARILTKLRALAAILQDREARFGEAAYAARCAAAYREFATEYERVHQLVLNGNPVYPMPAWQQRSGVDPVVAAAQAGAEIDAVLAYLLVSEGLSLTPAQIVRWRNNSAGCANAAVPVLLQSDAERRAWIKARLEQLDKQQYAFDSLPSVTFLSYQNYLLNQVAFMEDGDLDIWTLRQARQEEIFADVATLKQHHRFPNASLFIIVVDRKDPQYRTHFFKQPDMTNRWIFQSPKRYIAQELLRNPFEIVDADMRDCMSCHTAGPLRLRPRRWATVPEPGPEEWALLRAFNQRQLTYGVVTTDWPLNQPVLDAHEAEPLAITACTECHAVGSVRNPLFRFHAKSIVALMNAHEDRDGYYEYSLPNPFVFTIGQDLKTLVPSVYSRTLPAMPPLGPLTEEENAAMYQWLRDML